MADQVSTIDDLSSLSRFDPTGYKGASIGNPAKGPSVGFASYGGPLDTIHILDHPKLVGMPCPLSPHCNSYQTQRSPTIRTHNTNKIT